MLGVRLALVACALVAIVLGATTVLRDSDEDRATGCSRYSFTQKGVEWRATDIRLTDMSCSAAKGLIASYARPRNCQLRAPCRIDGFVCRTTEAHASEFTEVCKESGSAREVRWLGSYISR